jgi:hypothetical protein
VYDLVARRAQHRCEYCHAPEVVFGYPLEVEHIVPRVAGGGSDAGNLALSCRACNAAKHARTFGVDPRTGRQVPLFHPRRQLWEDHFRWSATWRLVLGRTAIGRATVTALRFNTRLRQQARTHWRSAELIP